MMGLVTPAGWSRAELELRQRSLGASEAAAVCGLSPWSTPLHVYLAKVGELESGDSQPKAWGRRLEEVVGLAYAEESGNPIERPSLRTYTHPEHSWLSASPDFLTRVGGQPRVLECKTSCRSDEWGEPGSDEIPDGYVVQVQQQLAVLGLDCAEVAVLIAGSDFRRYTVPRNDKLFQKMLGILTDFWERVQARQAPEPDWSHPATPELLRGLWAVDETLRVDLGEDSQDLVVRYEYLKERLRELKEEKDQVRARLEWQVGQAGQARLPNGWSVVRKLVRRGGYEVSPTEYRSFKVVKPKE